MEFDNSFEVPLPPAEAWKLLLDIERIAPCMPGAELTEVVGNNTYKGKIGVRLGPVALTFAGIVEFKEIDAATHTARVAAQGTDAKGRGGANASSVFRLEPAGGSGTSNELSNSMTLFPSRGCRPCQASPVVARSSARSRTAAGRHGAPPRAECRPADRSGRGGSAR